MILGRKTLFSAITILSILGYGVFVFAIAPTGGYAPGETLNPDCMSGDIDCNVQMAVSIGSSVIGGTPNQVLYSDANGLLTSDNLFKRTSNQSLFDLQSNLANSNTTRFYQGDDFLGIGLPGTGMAFQTASPGINMAALFDVSSFGGSRDSGVFGYNTFDQTAYSTLNTNYDHVGNMANTGLTSKIGSHSALIRAYADAGLSEIRFVFDNTSSYTFPTTSPTPGTVMGYVGNEQLGWVTAGGSSLTGYTGPDNTALGIGTGVIGLGIQNTFLGNRAGDSLSIGQGNTFVGYAAGGSGTSVPMNNSVIIGIQGGPYAWGGSDEFVAIGKGTIGPTGIGGRAVAVGFEALAQGAGGIAIGSKSHADYSDSIAMGNSAFTEASNQMVVGSVSSPITDFYFGNGVINGSGFTAPTNIRATSGGGNNKPGGNMSFYAGGSTGNAVGGDLSFFVAPAGVSGSVVNTQYPFLSIGANKTTIVGDVTDAFRGLKLSIDNNAGGINLGNQGGAGGNSTNFQINDAAKTIDAISTGVVRLGDVNSAGFDTLFTVDDSTQQVKVTTAQGFSIRDVANLRIADFYTPTGYIRLGDMDGAQNALIDITPGSNRIDIAVPNGTTYIKGVRTIISNSTGGRFFEGYDNATSPIVSLGDLDNLNGGPTLILNSSAKTITGTSVISGTKNTSMQVGTIPGLSLPGSAFDYSNSSNGQSSSIGVGDFTGIGGNPNSGYMTWYTGGTFAQSLLTTNSSGIIGLFTDGTGATYSNEFSLGSAGFTLSSNAGSYTFPLADGTTDYLLATDGSGQLFWQDPTMVPSDRSLKSNINELSYGLDTLMQLNPVSYTMNSTGKDQIGFIAQEVESLVPELVGEVANGKKGLAYGQMTAVIVKSVQEMNLKITDIENVASAQNKTFLNNLIAWLGDVGNGIGDLFANRVNTHELCVDGQCLNQNDVRQLIELKNQMHQGVSGGFGYGYSN